MTRTNHTVAKEMVALRTAVAGIEDDISEEVLTGINVKQIEHLSEAKKALIDAQISLLKAEWEIGL